MIDQITISGSSFLLGSLTGIVAGAVLGAAFLRRRNKELERRNAQLENIDARFSEISRQALHQTNEHFLQMAAEKLKQSQSEGAHDLEKRQESIRQLVEPVNKALKDMDEKLQSLEKARTSAYSELHAHIRHMTEDQHKLRQETSSLVQALRSPATRGRWGEMQLRRCLEMAGMQKNVHFVEQVSGNDSEGNRQRPDVIVKLTGGQSIIIDSKAPVDAYLNSFRENIGQEERDRALETHARHVREHLRSLGLKAYWEQFDTPEFVVMFLPGESYFSAALEKDPSLIEAGVENKVIPATPTTLISLLKAVMYGWRQEQLAENARLISEQGTEIYNRIAKFGEHMQKLGKSLGTAVGSYNDAVGSLERNVLSSARRLKDYHIHTGKRDLPDVSPLEQSPRTITGEELIEKNADEDLKKTGS